MHDAHLYCIYKGKLWAKFSRSIFTSTWAQYILNSSKERIYKDDDKKLNANCLQA